MHLNLAKTIAILTAIFSLIGYPAFSQVPVANFTATPLAGCSPLVVTFSDMSGGSPTAWNWDFGNGNTSTLKNPSSSYLTPGKYTVTLTVKNVNGENTLTRQQLIQVYETPSLSFSASQTTGCFPLKVQFTDNSTAGAGNTSTGWFWDFGDGSISTEQNPLHTYTNAGSFTITLKVTNDKGCSRVLTTPNYIQALTGLNSGFTNTQPTVCQPPSAISFTNSSTGPGTLGYQWNFGDGSSSTDVNPVHTYTVKGLYDVTLIVTSSTGCVDTLVRNSLVPIGTYNPSFTAPDSVCANTAAGFLNTSVPAPTGLSWDFGDGSSSTDPNPVKSWSAAGIFPVKMIANYGTCIDSVSKDMVVVPNPVADFTAPAVNSCQPPLTVNFQGPATGVSGWQWTFGDGTTSTAQNPAHDYTDFGNYDVTLIVTNPFGCSDTITKTAFVKVVKPQIAIPSLPVAGCVPLTITPIANITSADAVTSYLWDFGDGNTATTPNPSHTYGTQGTYTVSLVITTSTGCRDTLTINNAVRAGTLPVVNFSATPIPVCASTPVQFTDLSTPVDAWLWDFGDGTTSAAQNPLHRYTDTGTFTVLLTATNNGCPDPETKTNYITVRSPIAAFGIVPNCDSRLQFSFTDQSIGPVNTWLWDFGDGTTSTTPSPVHGFPALGSYTVTLTTTTVFGPGDECAFTISKTVKAINENPDILVSTVSGCKGSPIAFNAVISNLGDIASYYWDFGDAQTATTSNPSVNHSYTAPGNYTIVLITTDINGCKDTIAKAGFLRINGPTANFTVTSGTGCLGLTPGFNDLSTTDGLNAITSWKWDFGDGTIQDFSTGPFQHLYGTAGTYPVKLTVTDAAGCSDSLTAPGIITVTDPVPGLESADTLTCPGATVNFNNTSVATNYTSIWDFGDGSSATSPPHQYAVPGLYTVKLRITDQYGCADSLTKTSYIRVDSPLAAFTVNDSISSCTPFQVDFKDSSFYAGSVLWNFGDGGISTLADPTHYYGLPGNFQASLIVTSPGGCKDTAYKNIAVYDTAGSFINYIPLFGCSPQSVSFTAFTPGPVTYLWDYGDGNTDTTAVPVSSHLFTSFGDYTPRVIMQDPSGCLIPVGGIDTIHITGSKSKFGADKNLLCDSGVVNFIDSTTFNDPVINWNWSFGDGATATDPSPSHQYSLPGLYTVSLNTITAGGCRDTMTRNEFVKVVSSPLIAITGDSVVCVLNDMTQQGQLLRADTSALSWQWSFPNGNSSNLQNPSSQTYTAAGNFAITAIAVNSSGCSDTAVKNIVVNPLPTVDMPGTITVLAGEPVLIPATYSPNVVSWQWNPQAGLSCNDCPQPTATPRFSTTYTTLFVDSNGCRNSQAINIVVVCRDGNIFIPNTFSPNGDGSNDKFYPRGRGIDRIQVLRIFNRWGEIVFEKTNFPVNDPGAGWDGTFKGKAPQAGVYIFQVEVYCSNGELIKFAGNVSLIQ